MTISKKINIGIFGYGHLGKIHLKCLKETPFRVIGIFDPKYNENTVSGIDPEISFFSNEDELLKKVDAVDVVATTSAHFSIVEKAMNQKKHVFVEKPFTSTIEEAKILLDKKTSGIINQVGHVERFNPAFIAVKNYIHEPKFIESHRLAPIHNRGNDVSVVFDLMIHDLDIIMDFVKSPVEKVEASGISVINEKVDICNARLSFKNGCVANVTASRISIKEMRKIRVFEKNAYVSIDFLDKDSQIIRLENLGVDAPKKNEVLIDTYEGRKRLIFESPEIKSTNAIVEELNEFHNCIVLNKRATVSFDEGYASIELANWIEREVEQNQQKHLI